MHSKILEVCHPCRKQTCNRINIIPTPNTFFFKAIQLTLEFIRCSYDSSYIHVNLSILGVVFSHPPPHSEQEVAGGEAVSTERVTKRVLWPVPQLKSSVGVGKSLWN